MDILGLMAVLSFGLTEIAALSRKLSGYFATYNSG